MFERFFNRFNTRFDSCGSCTAASEHADMRAFSERAERNDNMISLLSLDTALAVSIFAAMRLIVIRLVSLISLISVVVVRIVRVIIIGVTPPRQPYLVSAN